MRLCRSFSACWSDQIRLFSFSVLVLVTSLTSNRTTGGRRRSDWTMLTPHIRCPLPLLRGTRGPWRSSTGGVGSGGGVGGWNGHGGGNGGLDSSGCGGSGNGGGGSSMREGESFIFSPSSSTSSARRRKGGTGPCGVGGSYEDGDVGFGEGKNGEGKQGVLGHFFLL